MDTKKRIGPTAVGAAWVSSTREQYGLSVTEAARMCCVTPATWKRWENGDHPMNPCIFHYWLSMLESRVIPRGGLAGKRWQKWHFKDGKLVTPLGDELSAAQIESYQEQSRQTRAVYREVHKAKAQAKSGLVEAGELWHGWHFTGGYLVSPDKRRIAPGELYVMMVGHDAMMEAKQHKSQPLEYEHTEVIRLQTK